MSELQNPFQVISDRLDNLERLLLDLRDERKSVPSKTLPQYLSAKEACEYLRLSLASLYRKTSEGSIPFIKKHKRVLFVREELDQWLKSAKHKSDSI